MGTGRIEHMFDTRGKVDSDGGVAGGIGSATLDPLALPPGPALAAALAGVDPARLDLDDRIDLLRAWSRLESWVAAGKARAMAKVAALGVDEATDEGLRWRGLDVGAEVVATALRISPRAAQSQVAWASVLTESCPATLDALSAGAISPKAARVVCEETADLDDEVVARVERRVLARAGQQTPQQLRRSVRRAVAVLAPRQEIARCGQEVAERSVTLTPAPYGMAILEAYLPACEAQSLYSVLTEIACSAKDRDRRAAREAGLTGRAGADAGLAPLDAYRADALGRLGARAARALADSGADPARWQAHIVVDLPTALGLADNPGELAGYGPIPGPIARQLAGDTTWTKWVTEEGGGKLVDAGRRRYVPGPALRELILARDQRCRFPGCEQPARRCDIDHAQPWDKGGPTSPGNLGALCRRHHRIKTHTEWSITESGTDGSCTWKTPTGEHIQVEPEPVLSGSERSPEIPQPRPPGSEPGSEPEPGPDAPPADDEPDPPF